MERVDADRWYRVQHVGDGVTLIDEPFIKAFYRCNIWHVRGRDRDLLIDSGMGVVSLRAHVPLVTEKRLTALASHTHFDHIGCHHEFAERIVHPAEADILAHPTRAATLANPYATDAIFEALPPAPYASSDYGVTSAAATGFVADGDLVDLGDRRFEVIHTPGHSPGGVALWEAETGILFSGDIVYDGPLVEDTYHANAADYVASMARLFDIPARVVHGGHFPSYDGRRHKAIIRAWLTEKGALGAKP
ncbi:MBL fold metallo-hydrolase [Acuticoccus sp. M5D2P5]|uniref:MBL fold metallo-hydrolase n=1 Tax=Acuticoccus kalidii TaxID=2910977 RepID=UPI001F2F4461|nr:MBL fold metallo-hydrolase [Acuticoccus kalidii]MCF3932741.1 MBL fold metallo-hydrolase [Acuticoccus kalidii]